MASEVKAPYPESQCHRCDARPRLIPGRATVFILCPRWPTKYPPQPQLSCRLFSPLPAGARTDAAAGGEPEVAGEPDDGEKR
jgi:hypothetical protein